MSALVHSMHRAHDQEQPAFACRIGVGKRLDIGTNAFHGFVSSPFDQRLHLVVEERRQIEKETADELLGSFGASIL